MFLKFYNRVLIRDTKFTVCSKTYTVLFNLVGNCFFDVCCKLAFPGPSYFHHLINLTNQLHDSN